MKLLFLLGNTAVGKMTVGQELTKITPFRLFHNHMVIEPVLEVFDDFNTAVIGKLRNVIFEEFAKSDNYGLIFTFMMAFDQKADWNYIERVKQTFGLSEEDIYYVELIASQEIRLMRNTTENRLAHKASKRDIEASNRLLLDADRHYRCESLPGEITSPNYIRIDNSNLSPAATAQLIKERFRFPDA